MTSPTPLTTADYGCYFGIYDPEESFPDPDYGYPTYIPLPPPLYMVVVLVVVNVIIVLLGLLGNGLVIWVIGFKIKKRTVTTTWYLSLALSDLILCATLPFDISLQATGSWNFGLFMCKFTSFLFFLNMFSSIFLMLIISVDRCVAVVFWPKNNRTVKWAAVAVVVAWLFSMLLSIPSLVVGDTIEHNQVIACYSNLEMLPFSSTSVSVFRFVLGFVFPLVIITGCYSIIIVRMKNDNLYRSAMPFKVMTALMVKCVICWLPYHIVIFLDISHFHNAFLTMISVTLVHVNSCLNPFLYAFMGKDIKQNFLSAFVSNIENALSEERPSESERGYNYI